MSEYDYNAYRKKYNANHKEKQWCNQIMSLAKKCKAMEMTVGKDGKIRKDGRVIERPEIEALIKEKLM